MKKYRDHYFKKAKRENYVARSVYKLKEIDLRFKIFAPGMTVLDLGAAPGSWTQYAAAQVGPSGRVLACDIKGTSYVFDPQVTYMKEDVFERSPEFDALLEEWKPFHVVVSDMAPKTIGHKFTDQARSMNLAEEALYVAQAVLVQGGSFVVKIFQGPDEHRYQQTLREHFDKVKTYKPKSSRAESKEMFCVGLGYKGLSESNMGEGTPF